MTTVNDGLNRDLNSLVKERRKTGGQALPAAAAKTSIPSRNGVAINNSTVTVLTETDRVEASFIVPAGGTVYVPTTVFMQDADGNQYIYNYSQPTIE